MVSPRHIVPHLVDMPMGLGQHLAELQRRLIWPVITLIVSFMVFFCYQVYLKELVAQPFYWAIELVGEDRARQVGIEIKDGTRVFQVLNMSESAWTSVSVSFMAALMVTIPVFIWQLWQFVAVALKENERSLAFLFVPLGVIMFYTGAVIGYFYALPYYYMLLLEWAIRDTTIKTFLLRQTEYWSDFQFMTVVLGLLMDIPWLVMVLTRLNFVTVDKLASWRKGIIVINSVICGIVAPPDAAGMLLMMIPVQLLFEGGLIASRIMMWNVNRTKARQQAEQDAMHVNDVVDSASDAEFEPVPRNDVNHERDPDFYPDTQRDNPSSDDHAPHDPPRS